MNSTSHRTGDRWEFDADVTEVFDDMLERSIPRYDLMRESTSLLASRFIRPQTQVLDLGCSRGGALAALRAQTAGVDSVRYVGLETSEPMVDAARERFAGESDVEIVAADLREGIPEAVSGRETSVALAVLALMFVPINYRQGILAEVRRLIPEGGAFLMVEKVLGRGADLDRLFVDSYHGMKSENGYPEEEIVRKAAVLEGVLVPVTAGVCEEMIREAGFRHVDCYWRWLNFAGWIALP